jgi:glucose-6-phosphate isomerase
MAGLRERASWRALESHLAESGQVHLRELFADDPGRGERLSVEAAGWLLDYSKQRVTDETLRLLLELAQECKVAERIEAMFRG